MKHVHTFESFINEAKLTGLEKNLYDKYAKKVVWVMQSNDIRSTSGDVNPREKKYNVAAKNALFINLFTKEDYNDKKVKVPAELPILYYGGSKDKESELFLKNKNVNYNNLYNKRDILMKSGDKTQFAELFNKFEWLPKTVFTKKEALDGAVGFPVIAKIKSGHSGVGIEKFDTKKDLQSSKDEFDLFCQYIDFNREYRVVFCQDKLITINERVPTIKDNSSIKTKAAGDKIRFTYVYQDLNKVDKGFIKQVNKISKEIRTGGLELNYWSLDVVVDKRGKLWVMETSSAMGMGCVKMCEAYKAIYEDFYGEKLPDEFLEQVYKEFVVNGHKNYWPKYKAEIESSPWAMDYNIITDDNQPDGYRYFFNLKTT
jgi:glutathione synthase/RimK-type ligase-like ATP-grasp enzyme